MFRRGTIDLLVRFSADNKLLGPTKLKKTTCVILFFVATRLRHISGSIGPTKIVNLSKFTGFNEENEAIFHEIMTTNLATSVWYFSNRPTQHYSARLKKYKWHFEVFFYLTDPRLFKIASRLSWGPEDQLSLALRVCVNMLTYINHPLFVLLCQMTS